MQRRWQRTGSVRNAPATGVGYDEWMPGSIAQPVRWGILSTANISHQFARDFAHADGGALVAVASRSLEKAQAFAERHGIARAYGCYGELLADPELDAVYVSTPHTLHYSNCLAAIAAGKAVLCEKPMTVTPQEARALVAAAASANVYLMEAMWTWFLPAIRRALAWVEAGHIGRLRQVQADFGFPMPFDASSRVYARELGGGCLLDMGKNCSCVANEDTLGRIKRADLVHPLK